MDGTRTALYLFALLSLPAAARGFAEDVRLAETGANGQSTRVSIRFSAQGIRPAPVSVAGTGAVGTDAAESQRKAEDYPFGFASELAWLETRGIGNDPNRAARRVEKAEAKIDFFRGKGQQFVTRLRPELSLVLAERRGDRVIVASAGGPLTRDELDVLRTPGEPLLLSDLLPKSAVALNASWELPRSVALGWSEYQQLASGSLQATLTGLDAKLATIHVTGSLKGSAHGASGSMVINGTAQFDRVAGLVTSLVLEREEARQAGPIESALSVKSKIEVARTGIARPEELSDAALSGLPLQIDDQRTQLALISPGGAYQLLHDRDWHLCEDNQRRIVLKRLDSNGATIAQCNLLVGPAAGRGRHQDLDQFRADVKKAIGERFGQFLGSGEITNDPALGFRYKLAVEGVEQEQGVVPVWYYYLIASPNGEQLIGIFTLSRGVEPQFADQDLRLMGSLRWTQPPR